MQTYRKIAAFGLGSIEPNPITNGERLEKAISRMKKSGIIDMATVPVFYTEAKQGVIEDLDIRTDKFESALNKVIKSQKAVITAQEKAIDTEKKEPEETNEDNEA